MLTHLTTIDAFELFIKSNAKLNDARSASTKDDSYQFISGIPLNNDMSDNEILGLLLADEFMFDCGSLHNAKVLAVLLEHYCLDGLAACFARFAYEILRQEGKPVKGFTITELLSGRLSSQPYDLQHCAIKSKKIGYPSIERFLKEPYAEQWHEEYVRRVS